MAEQSADNEPSMEEILSSIRRIINEDEEEPAAEAAAEAAPEPAADEDLGQSAVDDMFDAAPAGDTAEEESDVLELTDMVDDEAGGTAPVSMDDDLMIVDRDEEIVMEPAPEPEPEIDFAALESDVEAGIMGEPATTAATGSFHQLADSIRVSEEEGRTLEGVVRALIRPMLKEWLDSNLPAIVDDKVQAEIDRVARRRR
jgi:cell pole-organizing protein PopZ